MAKLTLSIELGPASKYACPCCQRESTTVHGYLYDRTGETVVYFAGFVKAHPERRANFLLSLGNWGEESRSSDRLAIPLQIYGIGRRLRFVFQPAEASFWYGEDFLGRMASADELSERDRRLYRQLARIAIEKDPRLEEFFGEATAAC